MDFPQTPPSLEPGALAHFMRLRLSPRRALHVLGVECEAAALALRWGEDTVRARQAALLHDITKEFPCQLKLGEICGIIPFILESVPPACRHAVTAAGLARRWGLPCGVVSAIRWHTTGRPGMGTLEKIIFLADMTEPSRAAYPGLDGLRRAVFRDLDGALRLGLRLTLEHAEDRGETDPVTHEALQWAGAAGYGIAVETDMKAGL